MKAILFDASLCNGCYGCQMACKDEHCGNDWSPIAAEQPITGQFWCRVEQETRGKIPEVKVQYIPRFCDQDEELLRTAPECVYKRDDGIVILDPEKAKGRKDLAEKFEGVYWNEQLEIPQKCTMCAHLLDDGWTEPRCVDVCATGALRFGDEEDFGDELAKAKKFDPESRYYYINIPKRWVYGVLVDRTINEVIIGAKVSLVDAEGAEVASVETDDFGEFRFKELDEALYTVKAHVDGYEDVVLAADATSEDVVLGDIFLKKIA